jgi:hypothetical protein
MTRDGASLIALASPVENAAFVRAAAWLNETLAAAGLADPALRVATRAPDAPVAEIAGADMVLTSLLPELDRADEPWAEAEARLVRRFGEIVPAASRCYLCTIFRSVGPDEAPGTLARIRRLNLLATELSRQTGLFVIDLDRALADIGARSYAVDCRLEGPFGVEAVAREMVATLIATGFHARFPRAAQESLERALAQWRPTQAALDPLGDEFPTLSRAFRYRDLRVQLFQGKEDRAARLLRQVVRREKPLRDFLVIVSTMVRQKGLSACVRIGWAGLRRTMNATAPPGLRPGAFRKR